MIFSYHISGDWGRPSASIVCRFPRNLWERDTVLAGLDFCPFGASLFPSHQARYFCSLVVQVIASDLVFFLGRGHRGKAPVKLCIVAFNFLNCNAGIPSLLGKNQLMRNKLIFEILYIKIILLTSY